MILQFLFFVFCNLAYASFNPFSLTNKPILAEVEQEPDVRVERSSFLEELELEVESDKHLAISSQREEVNAQLQRLNTERERLLSVGMEEEVDIKQEMVDSEQEEIIDIYDEKTQSWDENKEQEELDPSELLRIVSLRVKNSEERRSRLALPPDDYERLKTTPGEALKWRLPEESQLNIFGHKMIRMGYSGKSYLNTTEKQKTSGNIDIKQELEVKIRGIVKKKVSVNIDYTDKPYAGPSQKKFEVKYTGEKEEAVQEANFGDVSLELPQTRYAGYKKSGFGISTSGKLLKDRARFLVIASRQKGESKIKTFKGTTTMTSKEISDISYIKNRFYQVLSHYQVAPAYGGRIEVLKKEGILPIKPGSLIVHVDDRDPNNNTSARLITAETYDKIGSYTGYFDQKYPGEDYNFDYNTGILSFKYPIPNSHIVCASFINGLGTEINNLIIKYEQNEQGEEIRYGDQCKFFEIKGYYSIGYGKIPFNSPDFSLEIRDQERKTWYDTNRNRLFDADEITYVRLFGLDRDDRYDIFGQEKPGYNKIDKEFIDDELGLLLFPDRLPFDFGTIGVNGKNRFYLEDTYVANVLLPFQSTLTVLSNGRCYTPNPQSKYAILISYPKDVAYFSLDDLNIVPESERVYFDGVRLSKNEYYIDYETGYITIYKKVLPQNEIKVEYEAAPFLGVYQKSLFGGRFGFAPSQNFLVNGTIIGETGAGLKGAPSVTHPSTSFSVFGIDGKICPMKMLSKEKPHPFDLTINYEYAHSIQNPNTYGYGMIDNMDNIGREVSPGMDENSWSLSSLRGLESQTPRGKIYHKDFPYSERCGPYTEDGGHRSDEEQKKQKMLTFSMEFGTEGASSWVSVVSPLSREGTDLSEYEFIEVWTTIGGTETIEFYLDIGKVSEDADGGGLLDTEDTSPKDGILNPGEDVGWAFGTETKVGVSNGQLDSEDLDRDGILDKVDCVYSVLVNNPSFFVPTINTAADWKLYRIPVSKCEKDMDADIRTVKHIRLRFKNSTQEKINQTVHIDRIVIVGNVWEKPMMIKGTGTVSLFSKNSKDDSDYGRGLLDDPEFKKLHEREDIKQEGALCISYNLGTPSSFFIKKTNPRSHNYNSYRSLRFWTYGKEGTQSLTIRLSINVNNYLEYSLGTISPGWSLVEVDLFSFRDLLARKGTQSGKYSIKGSPNLGMINEIGFIVDSEGEGEFWINELHVSDVVKRKGDFYWTSISGSYAKWGNFNITKEKQDGSFRTIGPTVTGNDKDILHFNANISRFSVFPTLKLSYDKSKNSLSYENVEEVKKEHKFGYDEQEKREFAACFDLNKKKNKGFPILSGTWKKSEAQNRYADKNNDSQNTQIAGNVKDTYTFPEKFVGIPLKKPSLSTNYNFSMEKGTFSDYLDKTKSKEIDKISHSGNSTINFSPHPAFLGSNFSLSYAITDEELLYPGRMGTGTKEEIDIKNKGLGLLLKFYPKRAISKKLLPQGSFSTEYSMNKTWEDKKVAYLGIPGSPTTEERWKKLDKMGVTTVISPTKKPLETRYQFGYNEEVSNSNARSDIWKTAARNHLGYVLMKDDKGSLTYDAHKLSAAQNERKEKEDKSILLTHREIKYDLDKLEIKKTRSIPLISSTRFDKKFYFLEDYQWITGRTKRKKLASTSSHLGINANLCEIKWTVGEKDYKVGLSTSWTLDASANYDNIQPDEETLKTLVEAYNDFHKGLLFKRRGPEGKLYKQAKRVKSFSTRVFGINGQWYLYEPLLKTTSSFKYTLKEEENGVLWTDAISTEINNTLDVLKARPGHSKRFISSTLKANYKIEWSHQYTPTQDRSLGITHNPYFEWAAKWKNNLQTTSIFKLTIGTSREQSGLTTKNLEVYPSTSFSYEFTKPGVLKLPMMKKAISLEKKLTLNGKLETSFKRKKKGERKEISEDYYKIETSGTYKIQENTSGTLGFNIDYFTDRVRAGKDYIGYGSYLTFEFRF
ncbi:TPA: hypothetical protein DCX16_05870 [bacterium]|nr:hypothetical protein [bacterium]